MTDLTLRLSKSKEIIEPTYYFRFEVIFKSKLLSDKDIMFLREQIISINNDEMHFNINTDNSEIVPLYSLNKINKTLLDIEILIHNTHGIIVGGILLTDVEFNLDLSQILNFDYGCDEIIQPFVVKYSYDKISLINKNE